MKRPLTTAIGAAVGVALALGGITAVNAAGEATDCTATVTHDDAARTSTITAACPYPDQPTATATVTEPAPPPATVTVTATPTPTPEPSPTPEPEPTPTEAPPAASSGTDYGASVANGNTLATTQTKWGDKVTVRQFLTDITTSGGGVNWPAVPAGMKVHRSYKPPTSVTNAQIDNLLRAAEGQWLTFWHESDNDGLSGTALAARVNLMNRLYDRNVALGRPATIVHVVTGWMMASSNSGGAALRDAWDEVRADLIGIDADGIHDGHTSAPSDGEYRSNSGSTQLEYDDETAETMDWLAANPEYVGWTVPEFGTTQAAWDPTGVHLRDWIEEQVGFFQAAPVKPVFVHYFDYSMSGRDYTLRAGTPQHTYWQSLIDTN